MSHPHDVLDARTRFLLSSIDKKLSDLQAKILSDTHRSILVTGGGQAGKSTLASIIWLSRLIPDLLKFQNLNRNPPMVYWLVAQDYDRTSEEFRYIKQSLEQLDLLYQPGTTQRIDPGKIEIKGGPTGNPVIATIRTKSAKDFSVLAKEAPMGIIICEAAQISLDAYYRCLERMAPNQAWLFMSGTMEGSVGWYPAFRKAWAYGTAENEIAYSLPSHSNTFLYPGGENDPEILRLKRVLPPAEYLERVEGVPSPPKGVVFDEFNADIHVREDTLYIPDEPVYIGYDPGYDHACAVEAWQWIDGQVRLFDEIFIRGMLVEELADALLSKVWWKDVAQATIDISGTYHHGQTHPAAEVLQNLTKVYFHHQKVKINEGNARLKALLRVDPLTRRTRFVCSPQCRGFLSEMGVLTSPVDGQVRVYRWNIAATGEVVGSVPEDKNNDAIKAFIYSAIKKFGYLTPERIKSQVTMKLYRNEKRRSSQGRRVVLRGRR